MTKTTIAIPSYNHERFINQSLNSALKQTNQDFEISIIDDFSSDNTFSQLLQFQSQERVNIRRNSINMGANYSVNRMIQNSKHEYIALLNSDDEWMPDKLEKQVRFLDENPNYAAVFTHAITIDEDGNHIKHPFEKVFSQPNRTSQEWLRYFFTEYNCLCHPSILIRRSVYEDVGLYNPLMAALPDFEMWVRICSKYEIHILQEPLVKFRVLNHEKNASASTPRQWRGSTYELRKIFDLYLALSLKQLNEIFTTNYTTIEEAHFNLATIAINNPKKCKSQIEWGLDVIYNLMNQGKLLNQISHVEFNNLVKSRDIYAFIERDSRFYKIYSLMKKVKKFFIKY